MRRQVYYLMAVMCVATSVYAGSPSFTSVRVIDYSPHDVIGNCRAACTRANGGILFVDGYRAWVIQVADPLTADGATNNAANSWGVFQAYTDPNYWFATGSSYQGITYDGTNYYASGVQRDTDNCVLVQLSDPNNGNPYTGTQLTLSPDGKYSGCTAVGPNTLVMANYVTGALQFFTVSGATATATGSAIANPNVDGHSTVQVVYYESGATKKIFAFLAKDSSTRRIDVFNTDGTAAGTSFAGTFCTPLATTYVLEGTNTLKYSSLAVDPVSKVLVAAASVDTAGPNGYDCFNLDTIATDGSATPYQQIRDAAISNTTGSNRLAAGAAFFTSGANKYIAFPAANKLVVYQVNVIAGVNDWLLFN